MNKIIAIDFDNPLFKTKWPDILEPIWEVIERAKEEQRNGAKLILWDMPLWKVSGRSGGGLSSSWVDI